MIQAKKLSIIILCATLLIGCNIDPWSRFRNIESVSIIGIQNAAPLRSFTEVGKDVDGIKPYFFSNENLLKTPVILLKKSEKSFSCPGGNNSL